MLHLFNVFRENKDSDNCDQLLEEECNKMFGTKSLNDERDCNVVSLNSLNLPDANDMQSHKLGEAMFDEYDIFCPPSFDDNIYYDEIMPPIYDDYIDEGDIPHYKSARQCLEEFDNFIVKHEYFNAYFGRQLKYNSDTLE